MFFRRKHLLELGFQVMGLDFGRNDTCNHYVKYYPEYNSMVVLLFFREVELVTTNVSDCPLL